MNLLYDEHNMYLGILNFNSLFFFECIHDFL